MLPEGPAARPNFRSEPGWRFLCWGQKSWPKAPGWLSPSAPRGGDAGGEATLDVSSCGDRLFGNNQRRRWGALGAVLL